MIVRLHPICFATMLLAACGDGSSGSTELADPSFASKDAAQTPAEGTYVLGSMARQAIQSGSATYHAAAEAPPGTDTIWLRSQLLEYDKLGAWLMDTIPRPEACIRCLPNVRLYPASTVVLPLLSRRAESLSLGSFLYVRHDGTQGEIQQLLRRNEGSFRIHDDVKYPLNATLAEWRAPSGGEDFVQLQLATFAPLPEVFKLCLHQSLGEVRRLTCTLHDRQTAAFVGVQAIDDSTNTGPVEFQSILPAQQP
jgi:hypothetical protein